MFFMDYSINNFENWLAFVEFFLSNLLNKPKNVFAVAHEFLVWIASLSHVQRKDDLILSAVTFNSGFWSYFYKLVFTSSFLIHHVSELRFNFLGYLNELGYLILWASIVIKKNRS